MRSIVVDFAHSIFGLPIRLLWTLEIYWYLDSVELYLDLEITVTNLDLQTLVILETWITYTGPTSHLDYNTWILNTHVPMIGS